MHSCQSERIESGASMSAGTSSESVAATGGKVKGYFVATQDRELRSGLGCIPGVPVLYLNHVTLVLEAPSRASLDFNQQVSCTSKARTCVMFDKILAELFEIYCIEPS